MTDSIVGLCDFCKTVFDFLLFPGFAYASKVQAMPIVTPADRSEA
jgi:hypothetical protein